MKKKKIFSVIAILTALTALTAGLFLLITDAEAKAQAREWGTAAWAWVERHVLSDMLATGALVGLVSLELVPALKGLVNSRKAFQKTASEVEAYTVARIEYDARAEEREKRFYARMEEMQKASDERMAEKEAELLAREERLQEAIEAFRTLAEGYNQSLLASEERLTRTLHHVEVCADKTERMVYLGMSNSCELVKNGTARRIAEVEENEE